MRGPIAKVALVAAGYVGAIILASAAVAVRVAQTSGPEAQAASGMYAFGDSILFVAVFGVAALVPTAIALVYLRPYRTFWNVVSALGLAIAVTSVAAVGLYAVGRNVAEPSPLALWGALSVLRILIAPIFACVFLVFTILSPYRLPRRVFLASTAIEAAVTAYAGFVWFVPVLFGSEHL
jgi:hypothetical protein